MADTPGGVHSPVELGSHKPAGGSPASARSDETETTLRDLLYDLSSGREGHFGLWTGRTLQLSNQSLERYRKALNEVLSRAGQRIEGPAEEGVADESMRIAKAVRALCFGLGKERCECAKCQAAAEIARLRQRLEDYKDACRQKQEALDSTKSLYDEEYRTVDRCWKALGITDYAGAGGKSIWEITADLVAALAAAREQIEALRGAMGNLLDVFSLGPLDAAAKYGPDVDIRDLEASAVERAKAALSTAPAPAAREE